MQDSRHQVPLWLSIVGAIAGALAGSGGLALLISYGLRFAPEPPAPTRHFEWVKAVSVKQPGDCSYDDTGFTYGKMPETRFCAAADVGSTAICWDGAQFKNRLNPKEDVTLPWCTYKQIAPKLCVGGGNPGFVWECREIHSGRGSTSTDIQE